jgi:hypothetical protein
LPATPRHITSPASVRDPTLPEALHVLVSRLRAAEGGRAAGTLVESHPAGYRLAIAGDAVDAAV